VAGRAGEEAPREAATESQPLRELAAAQALHAVERRHEDGANDEEDAGVAQPNVVDEV
jgi:hypothetical protein